MGRPFVIELEGPVYKCKVCQTHLALPNDIICKMALEGAPDTPKMVYEFSRFYNTFLGPCNIQSSVRTLFGVEQYTYWVPRRNLRGPEGSDDEA